MPGTEAASQTPANCFKIYTPRNSQTRLSCFFPSPANHSAIRQCQYIAAFIWSSCLVLADRVSYIPTLQVAYVGRLQDASQTPPSARVK